ncbi:NAD(P)-binding protein [Peniophora sp. CONT]|nr:NAD(P)-binding protein [Peniophora sp. CONT]
MVKTVFFLGATGYIGGAILQRLLDVPDAWDITALVRNEEKAKKLNTFGVKTIIGSLDDSNRIQQAAADADIIIHTAHADHVGAAKAILAGAKARFDQTGVAPIYIHTSGTGVFTDENAAGAPYDPEKLPLYDDSDRAVLDSVPDTASHRNVDLLVLGGDAEGYVKSYIVLPATIWGLLTGKLVDAGIANPRSIQIPIAIKASIHRGQGAVVGKGENIWPHVEIHELADLYIRVLNGAVAGTATHGRDGLYIGENGNYLLKDAAATYTRALHAAGRSRTAEPESFTKEDIDKYFGGRPYLGSNSRAKAVRAKRDLGWAPTKGDADFFKGIEEDVASILADPHGTDLHELR